jgi:hypothetical protein
MPAVVSLRKVVDEIDMLFNDAWTAYLNRRTGETYTVTDEGAGAAEDPDDPLVPDWQQEEVPKILEVMESDDWIALPSKFDLHEYGIMKRFCLEIDEEAKREELLNAIAGRGAFRSFKSVIHRHGIQQQWHEYRNKEIERFVADWLDAQGIAYEK